MERKGKRMKKLLIIPLLFVIGCMPATQEEVLKLSESISQLTPVIREAVSTESKDTQQKVEAVLGRVEELNKAVVTAEDPIDAVDKGWGATKDWNPYYGWGALAIALVKMVRDDKKKKGLEKGVNRILGEAEPEQAKEMYDKIKKYTG